MGSGRAGKQKVKLGPGLASRPDFIAEYGDHLPRVFPYCLITAFSTSIIIIMLNGMVFQFAVGNVINALAVGYSWKYGDPKMENFRKTLEEFLQFATKPTILLLELYPWIRYLEPPFDIGFKKLKDTNEQFVSFFLEEIRKHKETLDENEPPRDYTDAYLIEMNKRLKAGNQGESDHF